MKHNNSDNWINMGNITDFPPGKKIEKKLENESILIVNYETL